MARYSDTDPTPFTGEPPQPPATTRPLDPGKPLARQNRIAAQLLGLGYDVEEVATDTGLTVPHLKVLLRSRLFQTEMSRYRDRFVANAAKDIRERIFAKGQKALAVVDEILDDPHHKDRLGAAREILGRIAPVRDEAGSRAEPTITINITAEKLSAIEATLAEAQTLDAGIDSSAEWSSPSGGGDPGRGRDDSEAEDDSGD